MNLTKTFSTVVFFLAATSLQAHGQALLTRDLYRVDKKIETEQKQFEFIETGVLKRAMSIRVFWDDNIFFNNYGEDRALDCFTQSNIEGDTIFITAYMVGVLGYGFTLTLFGDSCMVAPYAISDGDVYQISSNENSYKSLLMLPTTSHRVRLFKKPLFQEGESVAGHVQLKSVPYYYKDLKGKFIIEVNAYFKTSPLTIPE